MRGVLFWVSPECCVEDVVGRFDLIPNFILLFLSPLVITYDYVTGLNEKTPQPLSHLPFFSTHSPSFDTHLTQVTLLTHTFALSPFPFLSISHSEKFPLFSKPNREPSAFSVSFRSWRGQNLRFLLFIHVHTPCDEILAAARGSNRLFRPLFVRRRRFRYRHIQRSRLFNCHIGYRRTNTRPQNLDDCLLPLQLHSFFFRC